jgi:hypothetical protein
MAFISVSSKYRPQAEGQRIRQIGLQTGQIEAIQIEIQMAFMGFREGLAVAGQGQRRTVDHGRKRRFDENSA